jgi:carboxyl-terminal processing protease
VKEEQNTMTIYFNQNLNYNLLDSIYKTLKSDYISGQAIDSKKLLYGAAQGMANSLDDPYTVFMPPKDASSFSEEVNGEFE